MESKARLLGHPIHPMLIVFPLGLFATAAIFDGITLSTQDGRWSGMSFYLIGAGLLSGLLSEASELIHRVSRRLMTVDRCK